MWYVIMIEENGHHHLTNKLYKCICYELEDENVCSHIREQNIYHYHKIAPFCRNKINVCVSLQNSSGNQ